MFRNPTADLIVALLIVLLIFGPKRLPSLGKQLGQGLREFKDSITGDSKESDAEERPALQQASEAAPAAAPAEPPRAADPARSSAEVGSEQRQ